VNVLSDVVVMISDTGPRRLFPSVLVIEDDAAMSQSIAEIVREAGFHPVMVATLSEARASIAADRPGLVILDLTLQTEFGADLLEELADAPESPPVVIVSAFRLAEMIGQRFGLPVIAKPFAIEALFSAIEEAITTRVRPRRLGAG
jgi:DNA-binding response OmpR family regulator